MRAASATLGRSLLADVVDHVQSHTQYRASLYREDFQRASGGTNTRAPRIHRPYSRQAERLKAGIVTGVKVHGRDAFPSLHQPVIGVLKSHGGFPRPIANSTHDGHEHRLYGVRRTPGCHSRLRITWESFSAPIMPHCNNSA